MTFYEIKKIFSRTGNKIAVVLMGILLAVSVFQAVNGVSYIDGEGDSHSGFSAIAHLKEEKGKWEGTLTEEVLGEVLKENARINSLNGTQDGGAEDIQESDIIYGMKQGFADIRDLFIRSFCAFRDYDYYIVDRLTPEDAGHFYGNRTQHLKDWLNVEAKDMYSEKEKEFLVERYQELSVPWDYEYFEGWRQLLTYAPVMEMILALILGFLVAGIFSCETQWKADAVYFSSYYGRNRAVMAKIKAGFLVVTGCYWLMMGLYTIPVLSVLGNSGGTCVIQLENWKSFYNLTFSQAYLLVLFGGYIGCLFLMCLVMLISAKTKTSVFAASVPFIIIFLPSLFGVFQSSRVAKIQGLLPDRLLDINMVLSTFNLYSIGKKTVGALEILFPVYIVLILLTLPVLYRIYAGTQAR